MRPVEAGVFRTEDTEGTEEFAWDRSRYLVSPLDVLSRKRRRNAEKPKNLRALRARPLPLPFGWPALKKVLCRCPESFVAFVGYLNLTKHI
jgi:hypothetical protein